MRLGVGAGYHTAHGPYQRAFNDDLAWLVEASDVLIPSIYLGFQTDRYQGQVASSAEADLLENLNFFYETVERIRPSATKGQYVKKFVISGTMTPGVHIAI